MYGRGDEPENIAVLTGPEHAVAHRLLAYMYPDEPKLLFAANIMLASANGIRYPMPKNKQYGWLRERLAKAVGDIQRGRQHSDEERRKRSESLKGKPKSPEHVAKVSAALMGKPGTRRGAVLTDETKAKQSAAAHARLDKDENIQKMLVASAARTKEEFVSAAGKAWETRRANGTDKFSDEQRDSMSQAAQARADRETPEEKRERALKAAESRRRNGTDKYSDESRQRMSDAQKGKKQSPETVAKRLATRARNKALKAAQQDQQTQRSPQNSPPRPTA